MGFTPVRAVRQLTRIVIAGVAGVTKGQAYKRVASALPRSVSAPLERVNHRGETVTLLEGPILATAATTAAMTSAGSKRLATATLLAGVTAAAVGCYDDIVGQREDQKNSKGFRGHLTALREGRITTGVIKIAGIGAAGLAAGFCLYRKKPVDAVLSGAIIAGTANLINLFDLRPGRALKVGMAVATPLLMGEARGVAASVLGASASVIGDDLSERSMLGDCGANALGALLGVSVAASTTRSGKLCAIAAIGAVTAASERVSFTKVIASTPVLNAVDMWGRKRAEPGSELPHSSAKLSEST